MSTTLAVALAPDQVVTFDIRPGALGQFRATLAESGPLLKCYKGSVTLVSPSLPHESAGRRLANLLLAVFLELRIGHESLGSTTWTLPEGAEDTAYEPDESFYVQSQGLATEGQAPDLAIEVVVSHSEKKALASGVLLGIPELWVLDLPRHRLTFFHLVKRGKHKGTYQPRPRSRALPILEASEVLEQLDDPERNGTIFHENCRAWAAQLGKQT